MKPQSSRCTWSKEETNNLLALMKEHKVMDLLDGKTRRNNSVYMLLAKELAEKGCHKSSNQIKIKFRSLKQEFHKTKRGNNKSGAGRKISEHFQDLEELLGDRPIAAAMGLDTTMMEEFLDITIENESEDMNIEMNEIEEPNFTENFTLEPQENSGQIQAPKKKRNAVQTTLLEIAADIKSSHQSTLDVIKEENAAFMSEQRRMHEDFLKEIKEVMAEDRRETKEMLRELLNK